jgi:hypothetical protein
MYRDAPTPGPYPEILDNNPYEGVVAAALLRLFVLLDQLFERAVLALEQFVLPVDGLGQFVDSLGERLVLLPTDRPGHRLFLAGS